MIDINMKYTCVCLMVIRYKTMIVFGILRFPLSRLFEDYDNSTLTPWWRRYFSIMLQLETLIKNTESLFWQSIILSLSAVYNFYFFSNAIKYEICSCRNTRKILFWLHSKEKLYVFNTQYDWSFFRIVIHSVPWFFYYKTIMLLKKNSF